MRVNWGQSPKVKGALGMSKISSDDDGGGDQLTDEEKQLLESIKEGRKAFWELQAKNLDRTIAECERRYLNLGDPIKIAEAAWDKVWTYADKWETAWFLPWFRKMLRRTAIDRSRRKRELTPGGNPDFADSPDFSYSLFAEVLVIVWRQQSESNRRIIRTRFWGDPGNPGDPSYEQLTSAQKQEFEEMLADSRAIASPAVARHLFDGLVADPANTGEITAERRGVSTGTVSKVCSKYRNDVGSYIRDELGGSL